MAVDDKNKPEQRYIAGSVGTVRIFGVPIRLHFTFILLLVFLLFIGIGGRQSAVSSVIYILALFASVLLHELGHTLVARHYGIRTIEIVMFPIGGVSRPERQPKAREELWIALAGPTRQPADRPGTAGLRRRAPGLRRTRATPRAH